MPDACNQITASKQMVDCAQARFFTLPRVRRIIFGLTLCFLAALFAVEAKAAWVANAGHTPNDFTAVKLCPVSGKWIESQNNSAYRTSNSNTVMPQHVLFFAPPSLINRGLARSVVYSNPSALLHSIYFSAPQFFRPPPSR